MECGCLHPPIYAFPFLYPPLSTIDIVLELGLVDPALPATSAPCSTAGLVSPGLTWHVACLKQVVPSGQIRVQGSEIHRDGGIANGSWPCRYDGVFCRGEDGGQLLHQVPSLLQGQRSGSLERRPQLPEAYAGQLRCLSLPRLDSHREAAIMVISHPSNTPQSAPRADASAANCRQTTSRPRRCFEW